MTLGARSRRFAIILLAGCVVAGCNGAVLPLSGFDSPLLTIKGAKAPQPGMAAPVQLEVALRWIDPLQQSPMETFSSPEMISVDWSNNNFTMKVFVPPPSDTKVALVDLDGQHVLAWYSFAELVLYEDVDGNHRFRSSAPGTGPGSTTENAEMYRGGGTSSFVAYLWQPSTDQALTARVGTFLRGPAGYRLGAINCGNPLAAKLNSVIPGDYSVQITVMDPSMDMPFERTCLRSGSVPSPPAGP